MFAETEVVYAGKTINLLPKIGDIVKDLSNMGLHRAILLPSRISRRELLIPDMSSRCVIHICSKFCQRNNISVGCSMTLTAFLKSGDNRELVFEQLPFQQPLFILYSSGTSGKPKCIVHSAGVCTFSHIFSLHNWQILQGVLLNTKKCLQLWNFSFDDTYFQYTTVSFILYL